jgi:hypothetical protein
MENNGFIFLSRKLLDSEIWDKEPVWLKIWLFLLLKVAYEDGRYPRGTYFFKYKWIMDNTKATHNQVEKCIKYLKRSKQIATQKATHGMILTVLNYAKYQDLKKLISDTKSDSKSDIRATQKRYRSDNIPKEDKESKEIKKEHIAETSSALEPSPLEVISNLLEDKNKHIQIIGLFARAKGVQFKGHAEQSSFIRRNLRAAQNLVAYPVDRVIEVMVYLRENADFKWTLETVGKYIDEDLTKLNNKHKIKVI